MIMNKKCNAVLVKLPVAMAVTVLMVFVVESNAATITPQQTVEMSAQQGGGMLSGRLGIGYLTGEAHEYVFAVNGGRTKSELTWEIDSLYMLGFGGTIQPQEWLAVNCDLWVSVVDGDGYMTDYDWLVAGADWTHQSLHENTDVTTGIMFDINVEMETFSNQQVTITGLLGYRLDRFEWETRGGSYVYSTYGFRDHVGTFPADTLGITYEQTFYVPYLGIGITGDFDRVHLAAKIIGSFLVSGEAIDYHHIRNFETEDDFSGESMWAIDASIAYDITDAIGIKLAGFYEKYDTMTGDSVWSYNDSGIAINYPDSGGADLEVTMISTTLTYSF